MIREVLTDKLPWLYNHSNWDDNGHKRFIVFICQHSCRPLVSMLKGSMEKFAALLEHGIIRCLGFPDMIAGGKYNGLIQICW